MSNRSSRVCRSIRSSSAVSRSTSSAPIPASFSVCATCLLRGLWRLEPLPCANTTRPAGSETAPTKLCTRLPTPCGSSVIHEPDAVAPELLLEHLSDPPEDVVVDRRHQQADEEATGSTKATGGGVHLVVDALDCLQNARARLRGDVLRAVQH